VVFFMIDWAIKAGELRGIEASIMGLTFFAVGTIAPDCVCSVLVAKEGRGNMAISNVFGSNVFDVLIAMAIPWIPDTGDAAADQDGDQRLCY